MSIQMKFCPSCGGKLPEPAPKFCPNCGAPLQANSVPVNPAPANSNPVPVNPNPVPAGYVPVYYVPANNTKDEPIDFGEAIKRFWTGFSDFEGRASRAEYWWSFLFACLLSLIPVTIIATFIPMMAVSSRRFNDANAKISYGTVFVIGIILAIFFPLVAALGNRELREILFFILGVLVGIHQIYFLAVCLKKSESVKPRELKNTPPLMVKISGKDFSIGKFPVTRQEYFDITGKDPSHFASSLDLPVEHVSWEEAMEFCEKLTARERQMGRLPNGYKYTLPTSEQWEYACRAGTDAKNYSAYSEENLDRVAWYFENSEGKTHPVGQKEPNYLGLYDMYGNVREWCSDLCDWNPQKRENFGGSWEVKKEKISSLKEDYLDSRSNDLGFRVALVPEKVCNNYL